MTFLWILGGFIVFSVLMTASNRKRDETWQESEVRQVFESAKAVESGMKSPLGIGLCILSFILLIMQVFQPMYPLAMMIVSILIMSRGPKAPLQAASLKTADMIAPLAAGRRIGSALGVILIILFLVIIIYANLMIGDVYHMP